ncbi:hypothetical protein [Flavobacterium litorale]|uniref:DUF5017 domain-containing protein n=1 Tax=Flavobacterium litorale TaxID=2856519 RepID=A0ABX8V767_9FLAO|nr:hypothetical protein [Flavobacterium litorale]QYJ68656.1 hypothetical protein K1I41_01905 [Flavobacterium litorale]
MKKTILLLGLSLFMGACSDDDAAPLANQPDNNVLLLKVDMQTNTFEGGKELTFDDYDNFTIATSYIEPGDFGDIVLKYEEANAPIFEGTIVWNGSGEMTYPEALNATNTFATVTTPTPMPVATDIELVQYSDFNNYPELINYTAIWDAVANLQLVKEYRAANPTAKVNLFLYTPSAGAGNPVDWDWFVILKN